MLPNGSRSSLATVERSCSPNVPDSFDYELQLPTLPTLQDETWSAEKYKSIAER